MEDINKKAPDNVAGREKTGMAGAGIDKGDNNRRLKVTVIVLAVVAAVLAVVFAYIWYDRQQMINDLTVDKENLTNELIALQGEYSQLSSDNDSLNVQLDREREKVDQLLVRIKETDAANRTKIRQWLKKQSQPDDIARGKDALDKFVRKKGYDPQLIEKSAWLTRAMKELNISTMNELYIQISKGGSLLSKYANLLFTYYNEAVAAEQKKEEEKERAIFSQEKKKETKPARRNDDNPGIVVKGMDNLMIRIARCCNPVPGDDIVGFITKGRGISVHRKDCSNITSLPEEEKARFIDVEWEDLKVGKEYDAEIILNGIDRRGLFSDISRACEDMDVDLTGVNAKATRDGDATMTLTVKISSTQQMQKVLRTLRNIEGVTSVYRARS